MRVEKCQVVILVFIRLYRNVIVRGSQFWHLLSIEINFCLHKLCQTIRTNYSLRDEEEEEEGPLVSGCNERHLLRFLLLKETNHHAM